MAKLEETSETKVSVCILAFRMHSAVVCCSAIPAAPNSSCRWCVVDLGLLVREKDLAITVETPLSTCAGREIMIISINSG